MNHNIIPLPYNFTPRAYQMPLFEAMFIKGIKKAFITWHRRSGKDLTCWNILILKALERKGNYFYLWPEIGQGKKVVWHGVDKAGIKFLDRIPSKAIKHINNSDLQITLINGSTIQIIGAERYDKLVGVSACGIVVSEYSVQNPQALKYLTPALNETNGWMIINTTPRGHNHAYKLFQAVRDDRAWFSSLLTITQTRNEDGNPIITDSQIEENKKEMSIETIRQEFFSDFDVALQNAYFSRYLRKAEEDGRIDHFPVDESLPVYTFWDLGISDSMSICFVQILKNGFFRFVNYFEDNNEGISYYINYLNDWKTKNNVIFATHFAPHDVAQRELSTGISRIETFKRLGISFVRVDVPKNKYINSIERTRIHFNKFQICKKNCSYLLDCLMEYHAKESKSGVITGPEHNWASHAADSFMLVAQALDQNLLVKNNYRSNHIGLNQYNIDDII